MRHPHSFLRSVLSVIVTYGTLYSYANADIFTVRDFRLDKIHKIKAEQLSTNNQHRITSSSILTAPDGTSYKLTQTNYLNTPQHHPTALTDYFFTTQISDVVDGDSGSTSSDDKADKIRLNQSRIVSMLNHDVLNEIASHSTEKLHHIALPFTLITDQLTSDGILSDITVTPCPENPHIFAVEGYIKADYLPGSIGPTEIHVQVDVEITPENELKALSLYTTGEDQQYHVDLSVDLLITKKGDDESEDENDQCGCDFSLSGDEESDSEFEDDDEPEEKSKPADTLQNPTGESQNKESKNKNEKK